MTVDERRPANYKTALMPSPILHLTHSEILAQDDALPIGAQIESDATLTITIRDVQLNRGVEESVFELRCPPGYEETIEELGPAAPPPGAPPVKQP